MPTDTTIIDRLMNEDACWSPQSGYDIAGMRALMREAADALTAAHAARDAAERKREQIMTMARASIDAGERIIATLRAEPSTSQANVCPGCGSVDRSFKRIRNRKVCRDVWHDSAPPIAPGSTPAPPAVAGGDAPEKAEDVCECGHTRSAHAWTSMYFRCYHGRCQCHMFRRRQEGQ